MSNNTRFDETSTDPWLVGQLDLKKVYLLTQVKFPTSDVYIYPGCVKHVKKKHPGIWEKYGHRLSSIVVKPDFIGVHPTSGGVELYKALEDDVLLAINLDPSGYLFVSSFYDLKNAQSKIQKRLKSGRISVYI